MDSYTRGLTFIYLLANSKRAKTHPKFLKLLNDLKTHHLNPDGASKKKQEDLDKLSLDFHQIKRCYWTNHLIYLELDALLRDLELDEMDSTTMKPSTIGTHHWSTLRRHITRSQVKYSMNKRLDKPKDKIQNLSKIIHFDKDDFPSPQDKLFTNSHDHTPLKIGLIMDDIADEFTDSKDSRLNGHLDGCMDQFYARLLSKASDILTFFHSQPLQPIHQSIDVPSIPGESLETSMNHYDQLSIICPTQPSLSLDLDCPLIQLKRLNVQLLEMTQSLFQCEHQDQDLDYKTCKLYSDHYHLQCWTIDLLGLLLETYILKEQKQFDQVNIKWLQAHSETLVLKLTLMQYQIFNEMYQHEKIQSLIQIRMHLKLKIENIQQQLEMATSKLNEYQESGGDELNLLVDEYSNLIKEIEKKRWTLKQLQLGQSDE